MKTIISKLFAGSFNEDNIGHEVINFYMHDDNIEEFIDFHYLYIAPYGSVGKEGKENDYEFLTIDKYTECDNILFVMKTEIPYTFKIISYAKDIHKFESGNQIENISAKIKYNGKTLNSIIFKNTSDEDEIINDNFVSRITYYVDKDNYYDLRDLNIYIYTNKNSTALQKRDININRFHDLYPNSTILSLDFLNTWHNYTYFYNNEDFDNWFNQNILQYIIDDNIYNLECVNNNHEDIIKYNPDNMLNFIDKSDDENIITNMMKNVLKKCPNIANKFIKFLHDELDDDIEEFDSISEIHKQYSSLTERDKAIMKYINAKKEETKLNNKNVLIQKYNMSNEEIDNFNSNNKPKEGYIDLFIEGGNFRIVIENKVKSGLNDIYTDDFDNQYSQLNKYQAYLDDCNQKEEKNNKIYIFTPDYHTNFDTGDIVVTIITYSKLYNFFKSMIINDIKIDISYYSLLINSIAKHSHTLEDEIKERFLHVTK